MREHAKGERMRVDVTITAHAEPTNYDVEVAADGENPVQLTLRANRRTYTALLSAVDARRLARALELSADVTPANASV